ncbi:nitroreductase family deazaflavin-dependent oxidoreductase [Nocardia veterana]|uniref:Nitroreductase family deazaflavin-dependent oxidoreductase n=1 Tax=Nocardia veterana TaxID=132249 RepID=A0A7X6RHR7_9NOCA|nr:nitroreductase family deazaflavin-dependent oxidoreductase [Nocardia veterana]NKY86315.1 nitroreductase family deazaflavin-dependent oxidoreductase [Nocardia veterana]
MSFPKTPRGTRGKPAMAANPVTRVVMRTMERYHRFRGDRFQGIDLLYLTTVGAKSGQRRRVTVARFPDSKGWLIAASMGGSRDNPAWYHNIAAHPDQVWAEVGGREFPVHVEQLEGAERAAAWERICSEQPRFRGYEEKTDRAIPVLRLTPATG